MGGWGGGGGRKEEEKRNENISKENELNWVFGFASTVNLKRRDIPRRKYQTI